MAKKKKRKPLPTPSLTLPSSRERIEEYTRRFAALQPLHQEGDLDPVEEDGREMLLRKAGNGYAIPDVPVRSKKLALPETFSARLRILRRHAGLTQRQLANEMGASVTTVKYWEAGSGIPTGTNLQLLASVLKISTADLLDPNDE